MEDNKYKNGKIYKLVCNITNEIYIGSTIDTLNRRLTNHKVKPKRPCMSRQILDRGDYKIELIKDYPCNNEEELKWEERKHIDNNICINKYSPIITEEEKIERKRITDKNWYNKNKEEINKKITCECGALVNSRYLLEHKKTMKHIKKMQCIIID